MKRQVTIGTRGSKLALTQTGWFMRQLKRKSPKVNFDIKVIKTKGDKIKDVPLAPPGAGRAGFDSKGIFTKEIDDALLRGDIDIAIHSMKDIPTDIPKGIIVAAVTKREDPADCLILKRKGSGLRTLGKGSHIGTSSLRRRAQLLSLRKDLKISDLRGNLDTRLRKLASGEFDGIVVAYAGLKRLKMRIKKLCLLLFSYDEMLPACGQGALGIMARKDDEMTRRLIDRLDDARAHSAVAAERAFLTELGGGCQIPIGALAQIRGNKVILKGGVFSLDGRKAIRGETSGRKEDAVKIGKNLAKKLLSKGAASIIKRTR